MKVVFLTGTRADYGKLKPLMQVCERDADIENHIFVTGMHLQPEYGYTVDEIKKDNYENLYIPSEYRPQNKMELNLADTIIAFSPYVARIKPDIIVVHGDRVEPLAGSIVGVMNNVKVAHIEGGEITGTADEFMRHAITKLCHLHFVANDEAKLRLLQLGETEQAIHVIGSPDIDIMLSDGLPSLTTVKHEFNLTYDKYAILIYHPVTTSKNLRGEAEAVTDAVKEAKRNFIVIKPNNDTGSDIIAGSLRSLYNNPHFRLFPSLPFEKFLTLLRHADFIIGNSSAGIREACVYGVPSIDIGSRQNKRFHARALPNVQHCTENKDAILNCIDLVDNYRHTSFYFGDGHSAERFLRAIKHTHDISLQKEFVDTRETTAAINNYINEVCF